MCWFHRFYREPTLLRGGRTRGLFPFRKTGTDHQVQTVKSLQPQRIFGGTPALRDASLNDSPEENRSGKRIASRPPMPHSAMPWRQGPTHRIPHARKNAENTPDNAATHSTQPAREKRPLRPHPAQTPKTADRDDRFHGKTGHLGGFARIFFGAAI